MTKTKQQQTQNLVVNPIDENFVKLQMRRLEGLDFRPTTTEALADIKRALLRAKHNREVEQVVSDWLAAEREYPKPADLYEILYQRRIADGEARPSLGKLSCPECHGSGWIIKQVGQWSGAALCGCKGAA